MKKEKSGFGIVLSVVSLTFLIAACVGWNTGTLQLHSVTTIPSPLVISANTGTAHIGVVMSANLPTGMNVEGVFKLSSSSDVVTALTPSFYNPLPLTEVTETKFFDIDTSLVTKGTYTYEMYLVDLDNGLSSNSVFGTIMVQ